MVFLKEFFEKVDIENQQMTKKHEKIPMRQRVNKHGLKRVEIVHLKLKQNTFETNRQESNNCPE